ncbi:phasin family protein [Methylocystis sp. S23]
MATESNADSQSKPIDAAGQDVPVGAPAEPTPAAAEAAAEPAIAAAAAQEPVAAAADIAPAPLALVEEAVETAAEGFAASFSFDSSLWSRKSLDLWAENAAAFFELAEQVSKAESLEEIVDLQSRFARERIEAFVRQSKELMDFARSVAVFSPPPLCDARKAA